MPGAWAVDGRESGGGSDEVRAALAGAVSPLLEDETEDGGGCGRGTEPVQQVGMIVSGAPPVFELRTLRLSLIRAYSYRGQSYLRP